MLYIIKVGPERISEIDHKYRNVYFRDEKGQEADRVVFEQITGYKDLDNVKKAEGEILEYQGKLIVRFKHESEAVAQHHNKYKFK